MTSTFRQSIDRVLSPRVDPFILMPSDEMPPAVRLMQLKQVERIVRPLRVPIGRKRQMREELISHLSEIFREEMAQLNDPHAAMKRAIERFGDPAAVTAELADSLTTQWRIGYGIEWLLGARPPEPAIQYHLRQAVVSLLLILPGILIAAASYRRFGWEYAYIALKPALAFLLFVPAQFMLGMLANLLRDEIYSPSRKAASLLNVTTMLLAVASFAFLLLFAVFLGTGIGVGRVLTIAPNLALLGVLTAICLFIVVRKSGPERIADRLWASMSLDD